MPDSLCRVLQIITMGFYSIFLDYIWKENIWRRRQKTAANTKTLIKIAEA